ncbi:MAG: sugar transferase [Chloroflexi bacterium]|nr:sugar transferase [Chloroflexota bacterium]
MATSKTDAPIESSLNLPPKVAQESIVTRRDRRLTSYYRWTGWRLLLMDAGLIVVSFFLSYYMRYTLQLFQPVDEANTAPFAPYIPYALIFMVWVLIADQGAGLYENRRGRTWTNELFSIGNAATNGAVVIMALSFLLRPLVFSRLMIVQAVILTIILLGFSRLLLRNVIRRLQKRGIGVERVLIVGAGDLGLAVLRTLVARPDLGYRAMGFVDEDPHRGDLGRVASFGAISNLPTVLDQEEVDFVIVTLPWEQHRQIVSIVKECERRKIEVRTVPDLYQLNLSQVQVENLGGIPLLGLHREVKFHPANRIIKRVLDVTVVVLALPFVLPIIGLIALAIRLDTPGVPFFTQERIGLNGKPFRMIKFRSMVDGADALWEKLMRETNEDLRRPKLVNDPRITRVGKFLRKASLDELPNIFNVLKGQMSLVGPRPQLAREVALYETWQHQRLKVQPGMTGLWQISGRSEVPFDEMCLLDIYYIENWSLALDLQILLQTAPKVLFRIGAY